MLTICTPHSLFLISLSRFTGVYLVFVAFQARVARWAAAQWVFVCSAGCFPRGGGSRIASRNKHDLSRGCNMRAPKVFSLRCCRSSSVNLFLIFLQGNSVANFAGFFWTHKRKAQTFWRKIESIFRKRSVAQQKSVVPKFALQTRHLNKVGPLLMQPLNCSCQSSFFFGPEVCRGSGQIISPCAFLCEFCLELQHFGNQSFWQAHVPITCVFNKHMFA